MAANSKKSQVANPPEKKQTETWNATTVAALITAIATITVTLITTLFSFPPFVAAFRKDPTPTLTVTLTVSPTVSTDTPLPLIDLPLVTETSTPTPTATPTATETSIPSPTSTENPLLSIGMNVRLHTHVDKATWKAPLTVKVDARDSFLREFNGKIYPCKGGPCSYTWEVYKSGQKIGKTTENSSGTFQYTFGKKGTYFITVYICRGQDKADCKGSGTPIEVK